MKLRQTETIGLFLAVFACTGSSTPTSRLQISVVGSGSTNPPVGAYSYGTGTTVTVSAVPASGAAFAGWTGNVAGSANPVDVIVTGEKTLVAHFTARDGGESSSGASSSSGSSSSGGASSSSGSSSSGGASSSGGSSSSSGSSSSGGASSSGGSSSSGGVDALVFITAGGAAFGEFIADVFFSGGTASHTAHAIDTSLLTGVVPPDAVLQNQRWGEVTYSIPDRTPGSAQTVTLYFQENTWTAPGKRTFDVVINGTRVLTAFDIFAASGGMYRAIARTFVTTANASGQVVIQLLRTGPDNPKVNGIIVAASTSAPRALTVSRAGTGSGAVTGRGVDCGPVCSASFEPDASVTLVASAASGSSFAGWSGACSGTAPACVVSMTADQAVTATFTAGPGDPAVSINAGGWNTGTFLADAYSSGGTPYSTTNAIDLSLLSGEVPPMSVFQTERFGAFTYTIPNRTANSPQRVILYFEESVRTAAGQRTFDVAINGAKVLTAFDIYAAAGGMNKAVARSFDTTASSSGQVVIEFLNTGPDLPKVCGITVVGR